MSKATSENDDMRDHYDFSGGVRGKYAQRYAQGTNVVVLDPDVAKMFPDGESVNEALRAVGRVVELHERRGRTLRVLEGPSRGSSRGRRRSG